MSGRGRSLRVCTWARAAGAARGAFLLRTVRRLYIYVGLRR